MKKDDFVKQNKGQTNKKLYSYKSELHITWESQKIRMYVIKR